MIVYGTAFYPNLFQPNQMSNKFEMNIGQLDKDAIRDLTGAGLEVKTGEGKKEDHGDFIRQSQDDVFVSQTLLVIRGMKPALSVMEVK